MFAMGKNAHFSMRNLAKKLNVVPSVFYNHFSNEDTLLKDMFDHNTKSLSQKKKQLPKLNTTSSLLKHRISFQLDNSIQVVSLLKYYLAFSKSFPKNKSGFVPDKSSLHMEEVFLFAKQKGEYDSKSLKDDAKVITHAVNGFLLEFYPYKFQPKEKNKLVNRIHNFIFRSINGGKA